VEVSVERQPDLRADAAQVLLCAALEFARVTFGTCAESIVTSALAIAKSYQSGRDSPEVGVDSPGVSVRLLRLLPRFMPAWPWRSSFERELRERDLRLRTEDEAPQTASVAAVSKPPPGPSERQSWICKFCGRPFPSYGRLLNHHCDNR
jgi:hypothetical protein